MQLGSVGEETQLHHMRETCKAAITAQESSKLQLEEAVEERQGETQHSAPSSVPPPSPTQKVCQPVEGRGRLECAWSGKPMEQNADSATHSLVQAGEAWGGMGALEALGRCLLYLIDNLALQCSLPPSGHCCNRNNWDYSFQSFSMSHRSILKGMVLNEKKIERPKTSMYTWKLRY